MSEIADDPLLDATDWAHPAWWRGHEHTAVIFCDLVTKILDGQDDGSGSNPDPWHAVRRRLLAMAQIIDVTRQYHGWDAIAQQYQHDGGGVCRVCQALRTYDAR